VRALGTLCPFPLVALCGAPGAKNRRRRSLPDRPFACSGHGHKEFDVNWNIVEGNWKQYKGKVKAQWRSLTEEQLELIAGKRIELAGRIQETYGTTKDEAEAQIKRFEERNKD
jgi:uncharacterized protein YjbJ (UPF0337 family)